MAKGIKSACILRNETNALQRSTCLTSVTHLLTTAVIGAALVGTAIQPAMANPSGYDVRHGNVDISTTGNTLTVNQKDPKVIINWEKFSIKHGEHTRFLQPGSDSIALNRVTGSDLSHIAGKLTANGNVMLINPNGVIFGKTARVDVQGLVATTADISDDDFMSGNFRFKDAPAGSTVENKGSIKVGDSGVAALVAPNVRNSGTIYGHASKISLAGGDSFAIDLYGDGLVNLEVHRAPRANGSVENTGNLLASQGTVLLTTNEAQRLVDGVVNLGSIEHAKSARIVGGKIILDAGDNGTVNVAGDINASGTVNANGLLDLLKPHDGGSIEVKGGEVNITKHADLNAGGHLTGNGGNILVKASDTANIHGKLDATSSLFGGQGGTIEIGGKNFVLAGTVKVGNGGSIIIDPEVLTVADGAAPGAPASNTVYEKWIENQSQSGANVTLTASKEIIVENIADDEITGGSGNIALLANEGGSTVGAIIFEDKGDAITTTTGSIYLAAGSGGIDIGSLRIMSGLDVPGSITIKTVRGGSVAAEELQVVGYGNANIDVDAAGDVSVGSINAASYADNGASTAKVSVRSRRAGSNIDVDNVAVVALSGAIGSPASDLDATAELDMNAAGNLTVGSMQVLAGAGALNPFNDAVNVNADAQANLRAGQSLEVADADVLAMAFGQGNATGTLAGTNATASLRMRAGEDLTLTDTTSSAFASTNGNGYDNVSADSSTNASAGNNVTVLGQTTVESTADTFGGTSTDQKTVSAKSFGRFVADSGDVVIDGPLQITSDASSDSVYSDHLVSDADGRVRSLQGDVFINAPVNVSAMAYGNGAVPIEVVVEYLGSKANFKNSFGFFNADDLTGEIVWANLRETATGESFSITVDDLEKYGLFLIPNGATKNTLPAGNSVVTFDNSSGKWVAYLGGVPLQGQESPAYFALLDGATGALDTADNSGKNYDGLDHAYDNPNVDGNSNWEDKLNGGDKDYDDENFNITHTYGAKATANATANLLVEAVEGDVTLNAPSTVVADLTIEGSGYEQANADARARYVAGENVIVNSDVGTESTVNYQGIKGVVENVLSRARTFFTAKGNTTDGDVTINGNVHSTATATESGDIARSLIRADAKDEILFGGGIITDPIAQTLTLNGDDSGVQGRVTMTDAEGNDRSRLIFNQATPTVPGTPPDGGGTGPSFASNSLNPIFIDPLERFLISLRDAGVQVFEYQKPYTISLGTVNLSLLGAASNVDVSNLSPEQLGSLAPAAGGMGGDSSITCANSFLDSGYGQKADTTNCGTPNNTL